MLGLMFTLGGMRGWRGCGLVERVSRDLWQCESVECESMECDDTPRLSHASTFQSCDTRSEHSTKHALTSIRLHEARRFDESWLKCANG